VEKAIKVIFVVVIKNEKCFVLSRSTNETIKVKFKWFQNFLLKTIVFPQQHQFKTITKMSKNSRKNDITRDNQSIHSSTLTTNEGK
jgi:hypothetical protein